MLKAKIEDLINGIPHAVAILDRDLRLDGMNGQLESLTGCCSAEVRGILADYVLRANVAAGEMRTVLEEGRFFSRDGNIISAHRKKIPVRISASPLKDDDEQSVGMMVVLENIALLQELDEKRGSRSPACSIIGHSAGMQEVLELLPVLAATDATVLVTGETGTGKDMLAETIHLASKRARHPFIKVNCGAIPENLLESELFGHQRGAFTGAHSDKPGMFRLAHGGTIFLTEIGDLPLQLQVKLLTVLDDRAFYPLGSSRKTSVDVRMVTGTHRDLRQLVREGRFREDLFYRLNVLRAHLPPLRERGDDVRLLLDHFLRTVGSGAGKSISGFSEEAAARLELHDYPGNIRELRNIVEHAVCMCQGNLVEPGHLPAYLSAAAAVRPSAAANGNALLAGLAEPSPGWSEIERRKILAALLRTNGRRAEAAKLLGWGRSTLWRKIRQHGIE